MNVVVPNAKLIGQADGETDVSNRRTRDGEAACPRCRAFTQSELPFLSGDRHYMLSAQRRDVGTCPTHRRPCIAADDEAV